MSRTPSRMLLGSAALGTLIGLAPGAAWSAEVSIRLPLHRTAYQTNEWIDVSVARSDAAALAAGKLTLTVSGEDGSKLTFVFPAKQVPAGKAGARAVEHLHLDGRLLRPGKYTLEAAADGASGKAEVQVFSHVRRSDFKLIDWGSGAKGNEFAVLGQDSMGFNLIYNTNPATDDLIRGGADFMHNCTMSGAHQMDLRTECDWSDPYVLQGGEARVVAQALRDRTFGNCAGVHFYDEPGLTWWKDPRAGDAMTPFNVPAQDRSYRSAFGVPAPHWTDVRPDDKAAVARWERMNRWKESFMEAAWKYARFGVSQVRPDLLSVTQSQYGWMAYADGYYFNVARALPVISGHGGYDDGPATYFFPSFFHEMGRARDVNKPVWYMPTWYNETADRYRLEQYLSFMTDLQGMAKPPTMQMWHPADVKEAAGVVETNRTMARLGTIFTTMRPTRPQVAFLYSLSQDLGAEVRDMQKHDAASINAAAYEGGDHVRPKMLATYLAGKMIHVPFWPVVEEDVLDGTLAANHKAVIVSGVDTLEAKVVAALEAYAAGGGAVLLSDDSHVQIKGATKLGAAAPVGAYHKISELWSKDQKESMRLRLPFTYLKEVEPFAKAVQGRLAELGIRPALDADSSVIVTQRQAQGDIEYLFAVNATPNEDPGTQVKAASATLTMIADGRPVYDAVRGGPVPEFKQADGKLTGTFRFGAGQMRAFARTARPIGGVEVHPPVLFRDFTVGDDPVRVEVAASLLDTGHGVLSGSAPMQIRLIDPLGEVRYDLYRATDRGTLRIALPLAANDPAGDWKLVVRELLSDKQAAATFPYEPGTQCGAAAGATRRAVCFGEDREHLFRLFREHHDFTIVVGKGDYRAAAQRVADILKPWDVRCNIVNATDVKTRQVSAEALETWAGLAPGRPDPKNLSPNVVGFDLRGPAILLGTPQDNALIKFAADYHFLPYDAAPAADKPDPKAKPAGPAEFPGPGRGYVAWQRDAVGYGQESVTLIGYDAAGISEAVGSLYEAAAGLDPLTRYALPAPATVTPASRRTAPPEAGVAWRAVLPDRVMAMRADGNGVAVTTDDGSVSRLDASGKIVSQKPGDPPAAQEAEPVKLPAALAKSALPDRVVKKLAVADGLTALGYWGGAVQIVDGSGATKSVQLLPNDVSDLVWVEGKLIVGLADGTVVALRP